MEKYQVFYFKLMMDALRGGEGALSETEIIGWKKNGDAQIERLLDRLNNTRKAAEV